jgi:glycine/D-amino acid oxidase-like deaminating enzyme
MLKIMPTRYGQSPWIASTRRTLPAAPRLRGELQADVVIVGGGLTGTATALACATAGMKPVLLEADAIGHGWTGHSSGLLLPDPGPLFRDVSRAHGLRAAKLVFASWRRASLDAAALLRRLGVRCGLEPRDSLLVARAGEEKELLREYDAREAAGVSVAWLTRRQVTAVTPLDVPAAMRSRDAFVFDPYRACLGLARAASARGARLFERSAVKKVHVGRKNVDIVTADASVSARTVIVATGRATAEFRPLQRHFKTRETYAALSTPMPAAMRKQVGDRSVTARDLTRAGRRVVWTPDGQMLVVGADRDEPPARQRDAVLRQRTGQLMYEALTMYPAISGLAVDYGWSTTYGETADGLMYVGAHRNYPRHLFALGGPGDSATGAFLAARILLRALQDAPDKADAVFGWTR